MSANELAAAARALVAEGKGILAADESTGTITRRLETINVVSTPENRRAYREMLFSAPEVEAYISGVILYDETIRQQSSDGTPFPVLLAGRGIMPGIKVDTGTSDLTGFPGEKITEGLDGLGKRLGEYRDIGARFAKWRAVITIGPGCPTPYGIAANAHALARYAALSQQAGLVPIVEPEVLMDGDHTIERCSEVTLATLQRVFNELYEHRVQLEGMLLKPNMVLSGKGLPAAGRCGGGSDGDPGLLPADHPGGGAGHRVSLRRPERCTGHRKPQCHEPARRPSLGAQFFLRTGAAGSGS